MDLLGGTVGKNPPANARDTGSIPGPGRLHTSQGNKACEPQLLTEPVLQSPAAKTTESLCYNSEVYSPQSQKVTAIEAHGPRACAP